MLKNITLLSVYICLSINVSAHLQADELKLSGERKQGALLLGSISPGSSLLLNGRPVHVNGSGNFVIGFGRDASKKQVLEVTKGGAVVEKRELQLEQREYQLQRIEGVPQKTVTPAPKNLQRIKRETALVKNARNKFLNLDYYREKFKAPMEAPITGVYGSQRIYNGIPKRPHYGVDYAKPVGTLVYAPAGGVVSLAHSDMYYSGGTLIVDHGFGVSSSFLHLSEILVKEGDSIRQGDPIAKVGKGGRATGPHLDWRMNWHDVRIDPQLVLLIDTMQARP